MESKFSSRDIAEFKRTAKNVWPLEAQRVKLAAKKAEIEVELEHIEKSIALKEAYVMAETGHHVMELLERKVTITPVTNEDGSPKLNDKGKQVVNTVTDFVLKYPETIVPVEETVEETVVEEEIDANETVEEVETPASEATFNPAEL